MRHPTLVFATLRRWAGDPSAHVRRLVSEGSRPRLPWGLQLKALIADPSPTLLLLEALQDDPCEAVRRSVANHLNDIAKDHPELVAEWIERHLPEASDERRALLRHASRTLVKRGHRRTLAAFGLGKPKSIAFVYESTDFGTSVSTAGKEYAAKKGLTVVADEAYQKGAQDYRSTLTKIKAANPDLVFMVSYVADAILLMRQSKEVGLKPQAFLGGGAGFDTAQFEGEKEIS